MSFERTEKRQNRGKLQASSQGRDFGYSMDMSLLPQREELHTEHRTKVLKGLIRIVLLTLFYTIFK